MMNNILQQLMQMFAGRNGGGMGMIGQGGVMPTIPGQMPPGFGGMPSFLDSLFGNRQPGTGGGGGGAPSTGGELPPFPPPSRGNEGNPTMPNSPGSGNQPGVMTPAERPGTYGYNSSSLSRPRPIPGLSGSSPGMSASSSPGLPSVRPMPRGGL